MYFIIFQPFGTVCGPLSKVFIQVAFGLATNIPVSETLSNQSSEQPFADISSAKQVTLLSDLQS